MRFKLAAQGKARSLHISNTDGVGEMDSDHPTSFHFIIETDNFFVDLTAPQFDSPRHQVRIPRVLIVPLGDLRELSEDVWSVPIPLGRYIFCGADKPKHPDHWSSIDSFFSPIVSACVRRMNPAVLDDSYEAFAGMLS